MGADPAHFMGRGLPYPILERGPKQIIGKGKGERGDQQLVPYLYLWPTSNLNKITRGHI